LELFTIATYEPVTSSECYDQLGWFDITFGVLLTIGIWVSWLPQQIEFYRKKSTFGVSSAYIVLTQIANWTPFINALYLDWDTFQCCKYISFWQCQESLITIYQLGISTFSVFCIYIFYVIYYDPTDLSAADKIPSPQMEQPSEYDSLTKPGLVAEEREELIRSQTPPEVRTREKKKQVIIFIVYHICTLCVIVVGYMIIAIAGAYSTPIVWYAYILGFISAIVVIIQFAPQIYITYKLKTAGSLSLVMLVIQTPGTWVWFVYLVAAHENWSTWLSTFVAATQVSILLGQVIYYDYFLARWRKRHKQALVNESDEIF